MLSGKFNTYCCRTYLQNYFYVKFRYSCSVSRQPTDVFYIFIICYLSSSFFSAWFVTGKLILEEKFELINNNNNNLSKWFLNQEKSQQNNKKHHKLGFKKMVYEDLQINAIRCKKFATIVSGRKHVTQLFVNR